MNAKMILMILTKISSLLKMRILDSEMSKGRKIFLGENSSHFKT